MSRRSQSLLCSASRVQVPFTWIMLQFPRSIADQLMPVMIWKSGALVHGEIPLKVNVRCVQGAFQHTNML